MITNFSSVFDQETGQINSSRETLAQRRKSQAQDNGHVHKVRRDSKKGDRKKY